MLLIDTCGAEGSIGVANLHASGLPALSAERRLPGRETQERLMVALQEVLRDAGIATADLQSIAVVTGPGSFTGVRVGLAAAKGLAEALNLRVIALSRLAVLAAQMQGGGTPTEGAVVQAWLDAGRGDVFVGRYRGNDRLSEVMLPGEAARTGVQGEEVVVMEERLADTLPNARLVSPVGVREALPLALARARISAWEDAALLDANYLRVPDAEVARLRAVSTP